MAMPICQCPMAMTSAIKKSMRSKTYATLGTSFNVQRKAVQTPFKSEQLGISIVQNVGLKRMLLMLKESVRNSYMDIAYWRCQLALPCKVENWDLQTLWGNI